MSSSLRKFYLIPLLFVFAIQTSFAQQQCVIDMPSKLNNCLIKDSYIGYVPPLQLGKDLEVSGGSEPYTYSWSTDTFSIGSKTFYPSDILDDTGSPNPQLDFRFFDHGEEVIFYLSVTDSAGITCQDSLTLITSSFNHLPSLYRGNHHIEIGDLVFIEGPHNISGGIQPIEYVWSQNDNILENNDGSFWAFPDTRAFYEVTLIDSIGCEAEGGTQHLVRVSSVSVNEHSISENTKIFPNPATDQIRISRPDQSQSADYRLISINGKEVKAGRVTSSEDRIEVSDIASGVYLLVIESKNERLTQKIMIK